MLMPVISTPLQQNYYSQSGNLQASHPLYSPQRSEPHTAINRDIDDGEAQQEEEQNIDGNQIYQLYLQELHKLKSGNA